MDDGQPPAPLPESGAFLGSAAPLTRQRLRARRYRHLHRDVYAPADQPFDLDLRVDGLLLALPDACVSHETAGVQWRLPVDDDGSLHITRAPSAGVCERADVITHRATLAEEDVDTCRGMTVTSLARTFVDLAAGRTLPELVAIGDVVLRRTDLRTMEQAVARARRRKGVVLARTALPLLDPRAASPAESRCRLVLHSAGFPALRHAVPVCDEDGHWLAEADLGDADARVAVQYDGLVHLEGGARQRSNDVWRDELARQAGWEVVVITATDLRHEHLAVAKVRAAYERAAQRRAGRLALRPTA